MRFMVCWTHRARSAGKAPRARLGVGIAAAQPRQLGGIDVEPLHHLVHAHGVPL
jgi:hypothetical protein